MAGGLRILECWPICAKPLPHTAVVAGMDIGGRYSVWAHRRKSTATHLRLFLQLELALVLFEEVA